MCFVRCCDEYAKVAKSTDLVSKYLVVGSDGIRPEQVCEAAGSEQAVSGGCVGREECKGTNGNGWKRGLDV